MKWIDDAIILLIVLMTLPIYVVGSIIYIVAIKILEEWEEWNH